LSWRIDVSHARVALDVVTRRFVAHLMNPEDATERLL